MEFSGYFREHLFVVLENLKALLIGHLSRAVLESVRELLAKTKLFVKL